MKVRTGGLKIREQLIKETLYRPKKRMGKEDGGLACHTMKCQSGVDWGSTEIVARERELKPRKVLEGIESLRQRHYGMRVLTNSDHVDTWKPILNSFFELQKTMSYHKT